MTNTHITWQHLRYPYAGDRSSSAFAARGDDEHFSCRKVGATLPAVADGASRLP